MKDNQLAVSVGVEKKEKKAKQEALLAKRSKGKASVSFLSSVKSEFGKITWTTREELMIYTKAVIGATLFFGFGVYLVDIAIQLGLNNLEAVFRLIFG